MTGPFFQVILFFVVLVFVSCQKQEKAFRKLSREKSGVDFINKLSPTNDLNILSYLYYYNGGGVAIADFNNDDFNDIYFTSNQGSDKLYLNKGNMRFEDVTQSSGIDNATGWTTGVTHVDINNDGLLDIYVCKVGGYKGIEGANLLFVNQGISEAGNPIFKEQSRSFGLDISTFSTQSSFFDYDLDGDLDMFLLTHSVHPNRSYGRGTNRLIKDSLTGDRFFENKNGKFVDATDSSGIFQNKIGYGLGLAIGDLNKDGYPDIYIGNDFFENDYCYQNNKNKTFSELISSDSKIFGHTSHYSMGNCLADINNDGRVDIISLDMLPEDLVTLKSSGVEDGYPIYNQYLKNGYAPQYMQNTLHINRADSIFSEIGFQSGIASTEWSWGVLAADFDLDGRRDIYITNGILGATNDMDYINFISQDHIQRQIEEGSKVVATDFAKQMPEKKLENYAFRNNGDISFTNVTDNWFDAEKSFSNGCAYGDLDNDGDLDLVVNNINEPAFVFENKFSGNKKMNYVRIEFKGPEKNKFGIGARIEMYAGELFIFEEHFPVKSYLSSTPNEILLGLGEHAVIDSLRVTWPDFSVQTLYQVSANKSVTFSHADGRKKVTPALHTRKYLVNASIDLHFKHSEEATLDFDRDPLIPFALSNEGPKISVIDVNGDSLDDVFIAGAKRQPSALFLQNALGKFVNHQPELFSVAALSEDIDQVFFDADHDGDLDLLVVSGGNEFTSGEALRPRLYLNQSGNFERNINAFKDIFINASVVKTFDIENDGDQDVIICSNALPTRFGESSANLIFINDGNGNFLPSPKSFSNTFAQSGLINDAEVFDFDGNGFQDIVVAGDWMRVTFFMNDGKALSPVAIEESEGWWNALAVSDVDNDGDPDLVAGNWGNNTRLTASAEEPIGLYRGDFDGNNAVETIVTYYYKGKQTLLSSKDELQRQMPFVKKKFQSYLKFAQADLSDIIPQDRLTNSIKKEIYELATCYFENNGNGKFLKHRLPAGAQQSSVNAIMIDDFNDDGFKDILLAGNNYEISTQLGRLDASHGVLLLNDRGGFFKESLDQSFNIAGPARDIERLKIRGTTFYLVSMNNNKPIFLRRER